MLELLALSSGLYDPFTSCDVAARVLHGEYSMWLQGSMRVRSSIDLTIDSKCACVVLLLTPRQPRHHPGHTQAPACPVKHVDDEATSPFS